MSPARELFDRRLQARSLAYLFGAGAVLSGLALAFPHMATVDEVGVLLTSGGTLLLALVFYLWGESTPRWAIHAGLAIGIVLVTLANEFSDLTLGFALLYTWICLYAYFFLAAREALGYTAAIAVAFGILLVINDVPSPIVRGLLVVGTPLVTGLLISWLLGRLKAEASSAEDRAATIAERDERTRMVLETAHDAYAEIDAAGRITVWNRAAEAMFGWRREEVLGEVLADVLYAPEDRAAHHDRRRRVLEGQSPLPPSEVRPDGLLFESVVLHRDGTRIPVEVSVARAVVGDAVALPAFYRDLRERRRREHEQAQLHHEQAAREEAEQLAGMVSGLQALVDAALVHRRLDDLLHDLMGRIRDVLEADAASILIVDEEVGDLVVRASTASGVPSDGLVRVNVGEGFAGRIAAEQQPFVVLERPDDLVDPALGAEDITSLLGVPLMAGGTVTGVITVGARPPRSFSDDDLRLLTLAADRVALAIDNARVYEREHRIAETLQRSLLPDRLPEVPGLSIAARYIPAAAEAEVGGDWYDVIPIPGGRVGLVMGDVAGKGLAAASMVGRMRSALRAYALEGHAPAAVVERLNRLLWTELEDSQMSTLIYMVFDPGEGSLRWVNAGHPPPLVVMGDGAGHYLDGARSVPLGVMAFPSFDDVCVTLDPGGTVLLYTDGLIERPGSHLNLGMDRLAKEVHTVPGGPEELCDHLLATIVADGPSADDVALLALHNTPMTAQLSTDLPAEPESLASVRALLRRWLHHADCEQAAVGEIISACGEACANAIEHGAGHGSERFELTGEINGDELLITVRDGGRWRPAREGDQGRGLLLMEALMDSVDVEREDAGTTVTMRRRVRAGVRA